MKIFHWALLAAVALSAARVNAQDWDKGQAAYRAGDYKAALKEFLPLAESGDARAQGIIGLMYHSGVGVPEDFAKAYTYLSMAAHQGNPFSQYALGLAYRNGEGVPKNDIEASKWIHLSAGQGIPHAQYLLGMIYSNGEGLPENKAEGMKWYRAAAKQGNADAQFQLGSGYFLGIGLPKDIVRAYMWINIAAANGEEDFVKLRDATADIMTSIEITNAQAMSSECLNSGYKNCGE